MDIDYTSSIEKNTIANEKKDSTKAFYEYIMQSVADDDSQGEILIQNVPFEWRAMMNHDRLLHEVLNIGEEMMKCGAENSRVEDSMYRMLYSYGYKFVDVFAIPNNMQATVCTRDDEHFTQVRLVKYGENNYDHLDYLNDLSRYICANQPDPDEIRRRFLNILARPKHPLWLVYVASVAGNVGFGVYFGCDLIDSLVCAAITIFVQVWFGRKLSKIEHNLFVYNSLMCFITTTLVCLLNMAGIGHHADRIILGLTMLLISGLGVTNGIRDLTQRNIFSGILNVANAFLGGAAIAMGTGLSLLLLRGTMYQMYISPNIAVQIFSAAVATWGFAICFGTARRYALVVGIGGIGCCAAYTYVYLFTDNDFFACVVAAAFVAVFAYVMSRVFKVPATVFLSTTIMPIIPGAPLFYMMLMVAKGDYPAVLQNGVSLFQTCLAIAIGFMLVDIIVRYSMALYSSIRKLPKMHYWS